MSEYPTNKTADVSPSEDYHSQGTPTAPLQGAAPEYPSEEARYTPPPGSTQASSFVPPPPPPGHYSQQGYQQQPYPQAYPQPGKERYRRHGGSIVGPVILISAGIVFLLNNLDVLPWSIWNQVWRLWPLILIALGLDLVIGRRNPALSLLIVILLVGAGVAFLFYNGGFQPLGDLSTSNINAPLAGAGSARVTVDIGAGNLTLDAGANSESLATGTLEYYAGRDTPQQSLSTIGNQTTLSLRQTDTSGLDFASWFGEGRTPEWRIHLNPDVPLTFKAHLGTGNSRIDLGGSHASTLDIDSGTGNASVVFPSGAGQVTSNINGGVGNLNLTIPDGLETRVDVSTGIGKVKVDDRFTKQGDSVYVTKGYNNAKNKLDLKLSVGIGNVEISR